MHNGKFIPIGRVVYRAMDHPNVTDLSEEKAAEYAYQLVRRLGLPLSFNEAVKYVILDNGRAKLPKDIIYLRGLRYHLPSVNNQDLSQLQEEETWYEKLELYPAQSLNWVPVRYTGDIYTSTLHCEDYRDDQCKSDITYTINNNYAFLSEPSGAIEISYRGLIRDADGFPMIPDNQSFEDALYYYILKEHFFPLVGVGKISQYFYEKIEQNYAWYVGQATNALQIASMDHWESTMNGIRRLIQPQNLSDDGYARLHQREKIRKTF